jgi:hypothetical protein
MMKLAMIIWAIAAPTLMGSFVLLVLIIPDLAAQDAKLILPAAVLGALVAVPFSYFIARKLNKVQAS